MSYQISQHIVEVPENSENDKPEILDIDFFLQPEKRKIILGTVRLPNGEPAPSAVVKFYKLKGVYKENVSPSEVEDLGHVISDEWGQFLLGPVYPGDTILLKIFYPGEQDQEEEADTARGTHQPEEFSL